MHDIPNALRPGPDPVPRGEYAMWFPSPEEPLFLPSETRRNIGRAYEAAVGIETLILADLLRPLGAVAEDALRVELPEDLVTFSVLDPTGHVWILSASQEKGIRFHFPKSTLASHRNGVLFSFIRHLESRRRVFAASSTPFDVSGETKPRDWWRTMERAVAAIEAREGPVQAVGAIVLSCGPTKGLGPGGGRAGDP